jgi:pimeloyl-ACP methyl ester carboxylesterase
MTEEARAAFAQVAKPDWSDRSSVIDYLTDVTRACASRSRPFDEAGVRELLERVADRTTNMESSRNHDLLDGGDRWRERLGELDTPTLVIHGTDDPFMPYGHGLALAREIPGAAELLALEGAGHELPRRDWDVVVPAILEHTVTRGS